MRAVIVYESMFGNTRAVAEAIARGIVGTDPEQAQVHVVPAADLVSSETDVVDGADLLVVGGPTHAHSMTRPSTRQSAADQAAKAGSRLALQPGATNPGLREWFDELGGIHTRAAAFDTRLDAPPMFTGHAHSRIERMLHRHGAYRVAEAESFVVDKHNHLVDGELQRAEQWGHTLARTVEYDLAHAVH